MTSSIHPIPLSWSFISDENLQTRFVSLFHLQWLSIARIPQEMDSSKWFKSLLTNPDSGLLIRGCDSLLNDVLKGHGFSSMYVGQEALLHLNKNPFIKKSLRLLARRGQRHGRIREIPFSQENRQRMEALKQQAKHGHLPQLHHLFESNFVAHTRCFVLESLSGTWLAGLTISQRDVQSWQTELLLRKRHAPVGVMEALVQDVFLRLKKEGNKYWSLGEVPFVRPGFKLNRTESFLIRMGYRLRFAYNYEGLYRFKNKFSPQWKPVYMCANKTISLMVLSLLFFKTNFLRLVFAQAIRKGLTRLRI